MRIAFFCPTFLGGGIEKILVQLLNHMDKTKFELTLVILTKTEGREYFLPELEREVKIEYAVKSRFLNYLRSKRLQKKLSIIEKIPEELFLVNIRRVLIKNFIYSAAQRFDVIVDYGMCLVKHMHLLKKVPTVFYSHYSFDHHDRLNASKNSIFLDKLLNYTKIVAICDEMKEQFLKYYPNEERKITTIYNYVNPDLVQSMASAQVDQIDKYLPYIVAIGRLDLSQKDYVTLLKAFALCKKENAIKENLVILGEGRDKEKLQLLATQLQIDESVNFLGFNANPYSWIAGASLFVHASKFEGLPTVVIESMILKKIIVATNCPTGVSELLENGKAGLLAEIGDEVDLSSKIISGLTDSNLTQRLIGESQEKLKALTKEKTVVKFEKLLQEMKDSELA